MYHWMNTHMSMHTWKCFCSHIHVMCLHVDVLTYPCVCTHARVCSSPNTRAITHACFFTMGEHKNANRNKCFVPVHTYPCVWKHTHVCVEQQMRPHTCMFLGEHEIANVHTCITGHTHMSMHMCKCFCSHMHVLAHIHARLRAHIHVSAHVATTKHAKVNSYIYIHQMIWFTHTHPCTRDVFACGRANIPMCLHTCTCVFVTQHTCLHTCVFFFYNGGT